MKRFIVSGFELFFDLVALITKNGQKFYKTCEYWEPQQGGKFTLLNKVVIRKTRETGGWFEVTDDLGKLHPFSKGEELWKFSSPASLRVRIVDPETKQFTDFSARCVRGEDGIFRLAVEKTETEKKVQTQKVEQIQERRKTHQPRRDDYRKDPQAQRAIRQTLAQKKNDDRGREKRSRDTWNPWPKKLLTEDQKRAMAIHCHLAPLTQKLIIF